MVAAVAGGSLAGTAVAAAPDGRAYELVSPPEKNGGDVMPDSERAWAAADGGAFAFASLVAFGDVVGTGIATDYLAVRSTSPDPGSNGWTTRAITPPQALPLPVPLRNVAFDPMFSLFSPDLEFGVYRSFAPVTQDPYVDGVANLYLRGPLRSGDGIGLLSACPACAAAGTPLDPYAPTPANGTPKVAAMTPDGSKVLFESVLKLTSDAVDGRQSGAVNLYESAHGNVRLASILPDGTPATDAVAGQGAGAGEGFERYTPHVMSTDGARVFFTTSPGLCLNSIAVYVCGDLYVRDRSSAVATTLQLNATERTPPDPGGHRPATYWDASDDGSRAFFTSSEQLTSSSGAGLYRFDLTQPAGSRLTLVGPGGNAVLGVSSDGHVAYFTSPQQLVGGMPSIPSGANAIYAWTDGAGSPPGGSIRFIGFLGDADNNISDDEVAGSNTLFFRRQSRVSPDGRFLLFSTTNGSGLLSVRGGRDYDQGSCRVFGSPGCRELYLYDLASDTLACVSCRPDGAPPTDSASVAVEQLAGATRASTHQNRPLVGDGSRVFFSTADALVPEDVNGRKDAYEWDAASGQFHLLSDGVSDGDSYFLDASSDGADAFIVTRAQLVGWDTDQAYDVYDVRLPGPGHPAGFPEPPPPPPDACAAQDACRGPIPPQPAAPSDSSSRFNGPGNLANAVTCHGGLVPRTANGVTRCVGVHRARKPRCRRGTVVRRVRGHLRCVKRSQRGRRAGRGGR